MRACCSGVDCGASLLLRSPCARRTRLQRRPHAAPHRPVVRRSVSAGVRSSRRSPCGAPPLPPARGARGNPPAGQWRRRPASSSGMGRDPVPVETPSRAHHHVARGAADHAASHRRRARQGDQHAAPQRREPVPDLAARRSRLRQRAPEREGVPERGSWP